MTNSTTAAVDHDASPGFSFGYPSTPGISVGIALLILAILIGRLVGSQRRSHTATENTAQFLELDQLPFTQALQWVSYGKDLERKAQLEPAIAVYDQGLTHHPNDFRLWHERGLALAKLQQFESALASFNRAYDLRPNDRDLAHERGDTLLQLERFEEAIASFDLYLCYQPGSAHILADRGYALYRLNRYEEALQSLNQALKAVRIDRDRYAATQARFFQIETLRQLGRLEEALRSSQAAIQQSGNSKTFDFAEQQESIRRQMVKNIVDS
jgi:tetratricopeptide (TPR) repeat protein